MTSESVKAKLQWVPSDQGGRQTPLEGTRYSTVARFDEDAANWPRLAWNIVAEFEEPPNASQETIAKIRFLFPDGPRQLLHEGSRFELFEGRRVVARGEVLADEALEVPTVSYQSQPNLSVLKDTTSESMNTTSDTPQESSETVRAELAEKEEKLRKLVRQIDQLSRTEFRDRAQRLKQMRAERESLAAEIDTLKTKLKQVEG